MGIGSGIWPGMLSRVMTAAEDRMVARCWRSQLFLLLCTPLLLTFDIFRLLRGLFHHVDNKELFAIDPQASELHVYVHLCARYRSPGVMGDPL